MSLFSLLCAVALAAPIPRISTLSPKMTEVDRIFLSPGLVSVLEFPALIHEVRVGNSNSLKVSISTVNPKELSLSWVSLTMPATNLIVRAGKSLFVLDIAPSRISHQDYVRVRPGFRAAPAAFRKETAGELLMRIELGEGR